MKLISLQKRLRIPYMDVVEVLVGEEDESGGAILNPVWKSGRLDVKKSIPTSTFSFVSVERNRSPPTKTSANAIVDMELEGYTYKGAKTMCHEI